LTIFSHLLHLLTYLVIKLRCLLNQT